MIRYAVIAGLLIATLPAVPSFALTAKQKMDTCNFGADDQKLQGAVRKAFLAKCMANKNDPRGATSGGAAASGMPPPPKN